MCIVGPIADVKLKDEKLEMKSCDAEKDTVGEKAPAACCRFQTVVFLVSMYC